MKRSKTARNLFDQRPRTTVSFNSRLLQEAIGNAERKGIWLIYGAEKNGKTWFTLQLARDLASTEVRKVAYISAEEGTDESFRLACTRAGITPDTRILFDDYLTVEEIIEKFSRPRTPDVIFIDNLLVYADELKGLALRDLSETLPNKLLICVGHEERKLPFPASARMAKKIAKVYVHIQGLKAFVVSRFAPQRGEITINEDLSEMYWGAEPLR